MGNSPLPRNIEKSLNKQTRSTNGIPGKSYWQNQVTYDIDAEVLPAQKKLSGIAKVKYTNYSPDTLDVIVMRIFQDIFKKGGARLRTVLPEDLTDGLQLNKIEVEGSNQLKLGNVNRNGTILELKLKHVLLPDSAINILMDWEMNIPKTNNRMGQYDSTSFFLGYWYPQVAVYDDIDGWDKLQDNGHHEFYNEYADYKVNIIVPESFIVWATGDLINPSEVLSDQLYTEYQTSSMSDTVTHLIDSTEITQKRLTNNGKNSWRFIANNVNDFAFGISDHYLWDRCKLNLKNGRKSVVINTAYQKGSKDYYNLCDILKDFILYLDGLFPNISFPYSNFSVFNGYNNRGMEYPMIANNGSWISPFMTYRINTHETAHTYFPILVGTSEKKYSWIDEGIGDLLSSEYLKNKWNVNYITEIAVQVYENFAGSEWDCPLITPSYLLNGESLSIPSYYKSFLFFEILKDLFGAQKFYKILESFMTTWKGKHPTPYDLMNFIEYESSTELSWFFEPWIFNSGYPDLKIKSVKLTDNFVVIEVERMGTLPVPINLLIKYSDDQIDTFNAKVDVWMQGDRIYEIKHEIDSKKVMQSVKLNPTTIPDSNRRDNTYLNK